MNNFECERSFIESIFRPVQRNVLIAEYCNERFNFINLVDTYYRKIDSNAIFMFLIICVTFPILFMAISAIAEKYLSVGMQDLSRRFHLSPSLAATTLIAFANGAPDVLASFSSGDKAGAAFISIGALFGAFIFNATLVIANILWTIDTEIQMPKLAVLKEIIFYSIAAIVIVIFGFIKSSGYPFVITYGIIYAIYIFATIKVDRIQEAEKGEPEHQRQQTSAQGGNPTCFHPGCHGFQPRASAAVGNRPDFRTRLPDQPRHPRSLRRAPGQARVRGANGQADQQR